MKIWAFLENVFIPEVPVAALTFAHGMLKRHEKLMGQYGANMNVGVVGNQSHLQWDPVQNPQSPLEC